MFPRPKFQICFRDLQNYTTLKLTRKHASYRRCFRDLQNYTTLKLGVGEHTRRCRFRDLQNYTTLKRILDLRAENQGF